MKREHQPPQEFMHGIRMGEYLKRNPISPEQKEKNRLGLLRLVRAA
jgi:hypothetical protein